MELTSKERVLMVHRDARIMPYPGYERERVILAKPHAGSVAGWDWVGSRVFPIGTPDEVLWDDAASILMKNEHSRPIPKPDDSFRLNRLTVSGGIVKEGNS